MNEQKPEPSVEFDGKYHVHSIFHTIQGEGPFSGDAAVFVRLAGCNLQCPFCDTDYTGGERRAVMDAVAIRNEVMRLTLSHRTNLVVVSGGEPFRQDVFELTDELLRQGYKVQFETNGTLAPSDKFKDAFEDEWLKLRSDGVAIVVSPKAHFVDPWIAANAICYKYVLSHDSIDPTDGLPIMVLGRKSQKVARPTQSYIGIYVSPCDPSEEPNSFEELGAISQANHMACVSAAQRFGYRLQLQIHKHLGVE